MAAVGMPMSESNDGIRLHLGSGTTRMDGYVNVDAYPVEGVTDVVANLDSQYAVSLPWAQGSVTEIFASHLIEHIRYPLPLMQELWRVAAPGCVATFRCPYGSSDDADEDPTHVRRMFTNSWGYFSQPFHWRSAGYGYTADWAPRKLVLVIYPDVVESGVNEAELVRMVKRERNVVQEMVAELEAVKPARERRRELQEAPELAWARGRR